MTYVKPEVTVLASAFEVVRGSGKPNTVFADSPQDSLTIGAYEADE